MAIFEKSFLSKSTLDDTEKLICTLENAQNVDKHTVRYFKYLMVKSN